MGKHPDVDFHRTVAHSRLREFIYFLDRSIKEEKQTAHQEPFLERVKLLIEKTPLSTAHTRYANAAMRDVISGVEGLTEDAYLRESFGNPVRMDYGTGHELNFLCYLYCENAQGRIPIHGVFSVLSEYFRVVREYLTKFSVEAAGARGCWSIDDYLLLPFVLGSSENFRETRHIESIFKGVFREAYDYRPASMTLKSVCALSWPEINHGLLKMYDEEVFNKFVVTQHFIYSDELPHRYA